MTPDQVKSAQIARRKVGMDEPAYRMLLRNTGRVLPDDKGHVSTKGLTNIGFERVMAFLEERGAAMSPPVMIGSTPDYWRTKADSNGGRMPHKIHALFADYLSRVAHLPEESRLKLGGLCRRFSEGRIGDPERLDGQQQYQLIEALKNIVARLDDKSTIAAIAPVASTSQSMSAPSLFPDAVPSHPPAIPYADPHRAAAPESPRKPRRVRDEVPVPDDEIPF